MSNFVLDSLRGGLDTFSPVNQMPGNACRVAEHVEFFLSSLGERRKGTQAILAGNPADALTGHSFASLDLNSVTWMFRHQPTNDIRDDQLWVLTTTSGGSPNMWRLNKNGWIEVTFYDAPVVSASEDLYQWRAASLHGKLFISYRSSLDRLHVYQQEAGGATAGQITRAGQRPPDLVPTMADTGGAGTYPALLRFYRTRFVRTSGGFVLARSEPSPAASGTPSGANASYTVTFHATGGYPAADSQEDSWELEASVDGFTYFRIARQLTSAPTFADTTDISTLNVLNFPLSDPITSYSLIPSVRHLVVNDDRLITGGSMTTPSDGSAVRWTPVGADPLVAPDERFDLTVSPRVDIDALDGGDITGFSHAVPSLLVFKQQQITALDKTNNLVGAYVPRNITKARGALERSIVEAADQQGNAVNYFLDPEVGPMRYSANGLEYSSADLRTVWNLFDRTALVKCHGIFYASKHQIHYWIANNTDGPVIPTLKIVLQTNNQTHTEIGGRGGWSTVPFSRIATAAISAMFPIDIRTATLNLTLAPFIGLNIAFTPTGTKNLIQQCDVGTTDGFVNGDVGAYAYVAKVRSRPFDLAVMPALFGIKDAALLGLAGSKCRVTLVRDYGVESIPVDVDMTASGAETHVAKYIDNLSMSEITTLEVQFEDTPGVPSQWQLFRFVGIESDEQT